jgi:hypothetical protein
MTPRQQAIKDIKEELKREHKPFIAFNTALNPIMKELVRHTLLMQKKGKRK